VSNEESYILRLAMRTHLADKAGIKDSVKNQQKLIETVLPLMMIMGMPLDEKDPERNRQLIKLQKETELTAKKHRLLNANNEIVLTDEMKHESTQLVNSGGFLNMEQFLLSDFFTKLTKVYEFFYSSVAQIGSEDKIGYNLYIKEYAAEINQMGNMKLMADNTFHQGFLRIIPLFKIGIRNEAARSYIEKLSENEFDHPKQNFYTELFLGSSLFSRDSEYGVSVTERFKRKNERMVLGPLADAFNPDSALKIQDASFQKRPRIEGPKIEYLE
jgi:hypothetical protein